MKNNIFYIIVGILVVFAVFQFYQVNSLKKSFTDNSITGNTIASGAINMDGWTENEKMMYEHHGTLPARIKTGNNAPQSGMVGGC